MASTGEASVAASKMTVFGPRKRVNFGSSMQELQSGNDGEKRCDEFGHDHGDIGRHLVVVVEILEAVLLGGIDAKTKVFTDPAVAIKEEIQEVTAARI